MATTSVNRQNLGRQIAAARAMVDLPRVDLAKEIGLAHATLKLAEEGDPSVSEDVLARICRTLEKMGFEFLDGTLSSSLAFHGAAQVGTSGVVTDASMPGWVRRMYPRALDARDLVKDLSACGVDIENAERLLDLCATSHPQPWPETFSMMAMEGRKFGIRFFWRNGVENKEGVLHVIKNYSLSPHVENRVLQNILIREQSPI